MQIFTIEEILDMENEDLENLELTLSEEEKNLIIEHVREYIDLRTPDQEFIHDYLEARNGWRKLNHYMHYPETEAFKEAIFASFSKDWQSCRSCLETYFSYHSPEMIQKLDISQWDYRHIQKWFQMLINTDLYKEPEGTTAHAFFLIILEEGTIIRPSKLKTKFEKEVKQSYPEIGGLEALIRDTIHIIH